VPLLKCVDRQFQFSLDISMGSVNGVKAVSFIRDLMSKYRPLQPISLILKFFLKQKNLNEVYQGGIGSYLLLNCIVGHLQMTRKEREEKAPGTRDTEA
ncbi:hypothetical protein CYMTET_34497, partial [Cymbomonas tetramitiformis]